MGGEAGGEARLSRQLQSRIAELDAEVAALRHEADTKVVRVEAAHRRELLEAKRWGASLEAQLHLAQALLAAEREESAAMAGAAMAGAAVALEPVEAVSPCSPPRPRSSPSKPTYVPLSEWDLQQVQQASPPPRTPPAGAAAAGLLRVGSASTHAAVAIRPGTGPASPPKRAARSPDTRREPPLSPHATVV